MRMRTVVVFFFISSRTHLLYPSCCLPSCTSDPGPHVCSSCRLFFPPPALWCVVPCTFIARKVPYFLPSSTRIELLCLPTLLIGAPGSWCLPHVRRFHSSTPTLEIIAVVEATSFDRRRDYSYTTVKHAR